MAVPKQRKTKARQGNRRSHHALKKVQLTKCTKCGNVVLPHNMCNNCGTYRGKEVVNVLAKLEKRERKQKEKELAQQEEEAQGGLSMEELSKK